MFWYDKLKESTHCYLFNNECNHFPVYYDFVLFGYIMFALEGASIPSKWENWGHENYLKII